MNKELEEAKQNYNELKRNKAVIANIDKEFFFKFTDMLLQALENSIPKQAIINKLDELNKQEKEELKGVKGQDRYFIKQIYQAKRKVLQELLEGK